MRSALAVPAVLLAIGACYAYGRLIEVDWIRIKRVEIPIRRLPEEFEGFRIVHLSDLHIAETGDREKKLPAMVNSVGADAVVITGDFAHTHEGDEPAASIVSQFRAKHGVWGVMGNLDSNRTVEACRNAGMNVLLNTVDTI
jgi:hypothetical protein